MPPAVAAPPLAPTPELRRWLLTEARQLRSPGKVLAALAERLEDAGLVLRRASLQLRILHPQYAGRSYNWWRGEGWHREDHVHRPQYREDYRRSPVFLIHEGAEALHCPLTTPEGRQRFPVLQSFHERGITDYLALPLRMGDGLVEAVSFCSDRPPSPDHAGGFTPAELATLQELAPALAAVLELDILRELSRTLLDTYIGRMTGGRVLEGSIARGDRDILRAVIWYCDLREFTSLSEAEPPANLLALLDDWFERVVGPVRVHGGEVLKFMGDGMLAIFPVSEQRDETETCRAALAAARDAHNRAAGLASPAGREVRYGLALHLGDVVYGNVGAPDRLDFTVVGADVNRTSRIEEHCRRLGLPVLASSAFAAHVPEGVEHLEDVELRGVSGLHPIYRLRGIGPEPG